MYIFIYILRLLVARQVIDVTSVNFFPPTPIILLNYDIPHAKLPITCKLILRYLTSKCTYCIFVCVHDILLLIRPPIKSLSSILKAIHPPLLLISSLALYRRSCGHGAVYTRREDATAAAVSKFMAYRSLEHHESRLPMSVHFSIFLPELIFKLD